MKYYKLVELCTDIIDCPHSTPKWEKEGVRVVRNFNLKNGVLDFSDGYYVDHKTYLQRIKRALPEENDIIISREAPMGVVGIVPKGLKCCLGQRLVLLKVNKQKVNPIYLLFILMSDFVQTQFRRADATGSIVSNLCIPDLKNIIIPLVDSKQNDIAKFLDAVNNKIVLNKKINDNLLEMARTQYMHLFFKKKPNAKLGDIVIERPKSTIKVGEAKESKGKIPFFTSGDAIYKWVEALASGRNCFLNTGGNADVKFYIGDVAYSTDTWCISATDGLSDYLYLFLESLKPELYQKYFEGTGLKHLQKALLKERDLYIPTQAELDLLNSNIQPWLSMVSDNIRETEGLIALRNWLLPMLMNGQATIED